MSDFDLKEVHEQSMEQQTTPMDFDSLVKSIDNPKDKLLCACIATFADIGLAEQFLSHLANAPESLESKLSKTMYGIPLRNLLGATPEQAERMGLNAQQYNEVKSYLGLRDVSENAKARAAGIREN